MSGQGVSPWCSGFSGASDDGDHHGEEQSCPHKGGKQRKEGHGLVITSSQRFYRLPVMTWTGTKSSGEHVASIS